MSDDIEYRPTKRTNAHCRGCDKLLTKGEMIIHSYSHRCRGTTVILCDTCVDKIIKLRQEGNN